MKPDIASPEKGIMDLMRNLYEEGDDDVRQSNSIDSLIHNSFLCLFLQMKRNIAKAWIQSKDNKGKGSGMPDLDSMDF